MAKKKVKAIIKLYCSAGQANPAPPVGPALGQHGLNIMEFCKAFNEKTKGKEGLLLPVVITAYEDRTFSFMVKSPAGSVLLKQAASIARASGLVGREKSGAVTREEIEEIAKTKIQDLNTSSLEKAVRTIEGTARSMGIVVVDTKEEKQRISAEVQERLSAEEKAKAQAPQVEGPETPSKEPKVKDEQTK